MEEEELSLPEVELAQFDAEDSWQTIYYRLKNTASVVYQDLSYKISRKPENRNKNRYRDVSPYDHSRVVLQDSECHQTDYINASLVEVPEANRRYILTQGPLRNTSAHFWQMVWEQDTRAIIMLNRVVERETVKCDQYWPLGEDVGDSDEYLFDTCGLKVSLREEADMGYYITRVFMLENLKTNQSKEVLHFHYTTWPDFGVPTSPAAFLNFLLAVRRSGSLNKDVGPAVIHCSAGIGRSGTFCLVDSCLVMIEKTRTMKDLDLQKVLIGMRKYRMGLIQTADQLRFSYQAVIMGGETVTSSDEGSILDTYQFPIPIIAEKPAPAPRNNALKRRLPESESDDDDDSDLDGFIQDDDGESSEEDEDGAPPPPLPPRSYKPPSDHAAPPPVPAHQNQATPNTAVTSEGDGVTSEETYENDSAAAAAAAVAAENIDDPDNVLNDVPQFGVRRRNREERVKNTTKQIELMRERQRRAEIKRSFWTSWQPLAVGGALAVVAAVATYQAYAYVTK